MEISAIDAVKGIRGLSAVEGMTLPGFSAEKDGKVEGSLFDSFLHSAIDNIKATNKYLSDAEDEKIKFALGETENTHDLTIALQKASTALQYTVVVRDRLLDAYKEIMQMQI